MFKPNRTEDRVDYGNALMPPEGYTLEKAVGTTYSLDLEAITAMCISLGLSENAGSELAKDPLSLMHALQKISDKVVIFCEDGQIKFRDNMKSLVLLLEKMIVPVALPKKGNSKYYPSFHPKTWLLEYRNNEGNSIYKFVVLSRNLTFDRSWDVIVTLEGFTGEDKSNKAEPIKNFMEYLLPLISSKLQKAEEKRQLLRSFITELDNINFHVDGKFFDFNILPLGIGEKAYKIKSGDLFNDWFSDCTIMTPFLSGSIIANFNNISRGYKKRTLITRKTEMGKLNAKNADNFTVYVIKDDVYNGEELAVEESVSEKQKQDIHAKIYVSDHLLNGGRYTDLYLGSMNATEAAVSKNVEMMVRLTARSEDFSCKSFREDIFDGLAGGKDCPFEEADISCEDYLEGEIYDDLELQLKKFCREVREASVLNLENGKYKVTVMLGLTQEYDNLTIRPLRLNTPKKIEKQIDFELTFLELSEFYAVTAYENPGEKDSRYIQRIIMIPTPNIPDGRDSAVVNDVIKNTDDFLSYMDFVLGDSYISSLLEKNQDEENIGMNGSDVSEGILEDSALEDSTKEPVIPAIYEKMLKTAVNNPERIYELGNVMRLLKDTDIIPEGCEEMYDSFIEVLQEENHDV